MSWSIIVNKSNAESNYRTQTVRKLKSLEEQTQLVWKLKGLYYIFQVSLRYKILLRKNEKHTSFQ